MIRFACNPMRQKPRSPMGGAGVRVLVLAFCLMVCFQVVGHGQKTEDQIFVDGLRKRQLFRLAEQHIANRLASEGITQVEQGNMVIELMRTRMAAAVVTGSEDRESAWNSAIATGEDFLRNRNHPRELVIRVQIELVRLAYGKFLAQQLAAGISGDRLRERAIERISDARRGLEKIDREATQALPQAGTGPDDLKAEELRSLKKNVQYQLANCNLQAAKLFREEEQGNRVDALMQVLERLQQVGSQTNSELPLWWNVQIDRVEALRLQGKLEQAIVELNKLSTREILNSDLRKSDLLRQQIEISMDMGRGDPIQLVTAARAIQQTTAELDLSVVRLMMQTGSRARQPSERNKWQKAATVMTKEVEDEHGPYWGRLAELAVIGNAGGNGNTGAEPVASTNVDILLRVGDEAWRKKNFDDAVKAFDNAYTQARKSGEVAVAMTAGMKAAKILQEQGDHQNAGQRLVNLSLENQEQENAAVAHLSGCWNLGRASLKEKSLLETYTEQLAEHLRKWPEASSASQARIWLGRYQASQKQFRQAFETLILVRADSPLLAEAATFLPTVARAEIQRLESNQQATSTTIDDFVERMQAKLMEAGVGPNDRWTKATRELLLGTIKFTMQYRVDQTGELSRLLKRALSESSDAEEAWQRSAMAWLIVTKASRTETLAEAIEEVEALLVYPEPVLAECYKGMVNLPNDSERNSLRLKLIDLALPQVENEAEAKNRWMARKSRILVDSGRGQEAIEMLEALIADSPRRADLQIALGKALTAAEGRTKEALSQWRKVAAGSKQYSPNWFLAKFNVAKLLSDSGQQEDAKKLLDYLKIPPGWEKSRLKSDFDQLYSELGGRR